MKINLNALQYGKILTDSEVKGMLANQNYSRFGNQVIGEAVLWFNGSDIESESHIDMAPDGAKIQVREHYYGVAVLEKNANSWCITNISQY